MKRTLVKLVLQVAMSPGSKGEVLTVLARSGLLYGLRRSGVEALDICTREDNLLARPADPVFLGFLRQSGLQCCSKVTEPALVADAIASYSQLLNSDAMEALGFSLPSLGQHCLTMGEHFVSLFDVLRACIKFLLKNSGCILL